MTIIVKLGGCNGSGKSSVAKALLNTKSKHVVEHKKKRPLVYTAEHGGASWAILGNYENACGGMDTISDKYERLELVRRYANEEDMGVVFFEGLITGKTYGAFGDMSENDGNAWLYAFMDTPFDVCVERVMQRRSAAGNMAPFDPERTMRSTFRSVESVARRAQEVGHEVIMLDHTEPAATLAKRLIAKVKTMQVLK